jgi:DNA-binding transcriptional LysR family regulator
MKLQQLQALVAVVERGGIRAAALELHVSQAAVTKSMRLLEEEVGVPLLLRRSRGVDLTEAGERLLARARLIIRQEAVAREELRQFAGDDYGSVSVGVTPFVTLAVLGEAFRWFRQRYRNVQLHLMEGLMARVLPQLRQGSLDVALVAAEIGDLDRDRFSATPIARAPRRVVVRAGHPVLQAPTARALAELEWVVAPALDARRLSRFETMFINAGVPVPHKTVSCETLAALTLLRNADVASVFPEPLLGHPESRGIVPVVSELRPCDMELTLLSRPDVPLSPAAAYFSHCLLETCRSSQIGLGPKAALVSDSSTGASS